MNKVTHQVIGRCSNADMKQPDPSDAVIGI